MAYDCGGALCTGAGDFDSQGNYTGGGQSGGGFDWSTFASGAFNFAGDLLSFGSTLYTVNRTGQPAPVAGMPYYPWQTQPGVTTTQNNTALYIGLSVLALLVLVVVIYLFTRTTAKA